MFNLKGNQREGEVATAKECITRRMQKQQSAAVKSEVSIQKQARGPVYSIYVASLAEDKMASFFGHINGESVKRTTDGKVFAHDYMYGTECVFEKDTSHQEIKKSRVYWRVEMVHDETETIFCIGIPQHFGYASYTSGWDKAGQTLCFYLESDQNGTLKIEWGNLEEGSEYLADADHGSIPINFGANGDVRVWWELVQFVEQEARRGRTYASSGTGF